MIPQRTADAFKVMGEHIDRMGGVSEPLALREALLGAGFTAFDVQEAIQLGLSNYAIRFDGKLRIQATGQGYVMEAR